MAVKYQCENCGELYDRDKDLKTVKLSIDGVEFTPEFCKTCRDKLKADPLTLFNGGLVFVQTIKDEIRLAALAPKPIKKDKAVA